MTDPPDFGASTYRNSISVRDMLGNSFSSSYLTMLSWVLAPESNPVLKEVSSEVPCFSGGSLVLVLRAMRSLSDGVEEAAGSKGFLFSGSGSSGSRTIGIFKSRSSSSSSSPFFRMRGSLSVVSSLGS